MSYKPTRREFFRDLTIGATGMLAAPSLLAQRDADPAGWDLVPSILHRIKSPRFPRREFDITRYGARPDGKTDCTVAFASAIAACNRAGGGRVVVPAGRFLTGAIHLRSNVNLHTLKDSTILFSTDPAKYLPNV